MILGSLPSESVGDTRKATSYLVVGGPKGRFIRSGADSSGVFRISNMVPETKQEG